MSHSYYPFSFRNWFYVPRGRNCPADCVASNDAFLLQLIDNCQCLFHNESIDSQVMPSHLRLAVLMRVHRGRTASCPIAPAPGSSGILASAHSSRFGRTNRGTWFRANGSQMCMLCHMAGTCIWTPSILCFIGRLPHLLNYTSLQPPAPATPQSPPPPARPGSGAIVSPWPGTRRRQLTGGEYCAILLSR